MSIGSVAWFIFCAARKRLDRQDAWDGKNRREGKWANCRLGSPLRFSGNLRARQEHEKQKMEKEHKEEAEAERARARERDQSQHLLYEARYSSRDGRELASSHFTSQSRVFLYKRQKTVACDIQLMCLLPVQPSFPYHSYISIPLDRDVLLFATSSFASLLRFNLHLPLKRLLLHCWWLPDEDFFSFLLLASSCSSSPSYYSFRVNLRERRFTQIVTRRSQSEAESCGSHAFENWSGWHTRLCMYIPSSSSSAFTLERR